MISETEVRAEEDEDGDGNSTGTEPLAVASGCPILRTPMSDKTIHEVTRSGSIFCFVSFRVNSWIVPSGN
jgi:hypothetical protein